MGRISRATLRQIARYGSPARGGPGDPVTRRTLYPSGGGSSVFDLQTDARKYMQAVAVGLGTTVQATSVAAPGESGTKTAFQDSTGHYINWATAGTLSSPAGWTSFVTASVQRQLLFDLLWVTKTGPAASDIANCTIWVDVQDASGVVNTTSTANMVGFRFRTAVPDTNWMCISTDVANSITATNSGVVVAVNTRYIFRMRFVDTSTLEFYIDGVLVATHTTSDNLPDLDATLGYESNIINNLVGTARNFRILQMKGTQV